jgi:hypothetical protein
LPHAKENEGSDRRARNEPLVCAPEMTRTSDLRFRKPSLYPPELRGRISCRSCGDLPLLLRHVVQEGGDRRICELPTSTEEVQLNEESVPGH